MSRFNTSTQEKKYNKSPCKFYMQGKCKNGIRGTNCSFPNPNMCFRFIRQGNKGCNKGVSCSSVARGGAGVAVAPPEHLRKKLAPFPLSPFLKLFLNFNINLLI